MASLAKKSSSPKCTWAQRHGVIWVTLVIADVDPKKAEITLTADKLTFKGESNGTMYDYIRITGSCSITLAFTRTSGVSTSIGTPGAGMRMLAVCAAFSISELSPEKAPARSRP